ncbi:MAG: D-alanine--D-alanine ligase, partial [Candidatus Marinimicrobia bacterium]|nr:D-alanine--D-alanine ligase [Candidatus Neomarinimicrobiota bacterium]
MKPTGKQASIAVLMGGVNSESQVSMESGERIMAALSTLGYRVVPLVYEGDLATTIPALA